MTIQRTYLNIPYCNPSMPKALEEGKRFSHSRSVLAEPTKSILKKPCENPKSRKSKKVSFNKKVTARIFKKSLNLDSLERTLEIERIKPAPKKEYLGELPWEIDEYLQEKMSKISKGYSSLFKVDKKHLQAFLNTQEKNIKYINSKEKPTSLENIKQTSSTIKIEFALDRFLRKTDRIFLQLVNHIKKHHSTMSQFRKNATKFLKKICPLREEIEPAVSKNNESIAEISAKSQRQRWCFYKKKSFDLANMLNPLERHPHFLKKFLNKSLKKPLQEFSPIASTTVRNSTSSEGFTRSRASSFPPKGSPEINTPRYSDRSINQEDQKMSIDFRINKNCQGSRSPSISRISSFASMSHLDIDSLKSTNRLISPEDEKKSNHF